MFFGASKLKTENERLETEIKAAQTRAEALQTDNERLQIEVTQARSDAESAHNKQQNRLRELWFSGTDAVTDIRENMASSATLLSEERYHLDQAQNTFSHSSDILQQMEGSLQSISADADRNCQHITELQNTAEEISKFIGVIREISEQTNLLALNAAIEAARAGEQGRGFAVVADEVRALAQKANDASAEITRLVTNITQRTTVADSDIRGMAEQSRTLVSSTSEVSQAVTEVVGLSQRMYGIVGRSASETFIQTVKLDHVVWKTEIYKALLGLSKKPSSDFASHTHCRLGQWYFDGEGKTNYAHTSSYRQLDEPHKGVHENGIKALERMQEGELDDALSAIASMEACSLQLIELLSRLSDELH
jgi:methyl-accepting chemotaxis protein